MNQQTPFWIVGLCALVSPALGDVFLMKDNTKLEGVLVREEASSYVVEVQISKSIKDERVIAKADVKSIEIAKEDDEAFKRIASLGRVADGFSIDEYDLRIDQIERFKTRYPSSSKVKEATALLTALREERQVIKDGGLKLNGVIYTPQDYHSNAYDLDASLAAHAIQRLVVSGHYLQALRAFSDFEKDYGATDSYSSLTPMILEAIRRYINDVAQTQATYDQRVKEREEGLLRMDDRDRGQSVIAIQQQEEELERQFEQQKNAKLSWVTPDPFCKSALDHTLSYGKTELKRLESPKSTKSASMNGGKVYRDVMALAKRGADPQAAKQAILKAKQAGIPQKYLDQLQVELDASAPPEK